MNMLALLGIGNPSKTMHFIREVHMGEDGGLAKGALDSRAPVFLPGRTGVSQ